MTKEEAAEIIALADSMASAKEHLGLAVGMNSPSLFEHWNAKYKNRLDVFVDAVQDKIKG